MTAKDRLIAPIANHGLLKDLDPHHAHTLASLALEAQFQPAQVIFKEKDTSGYFYLILSGSVAIEIVTPARHIQIETLHDGDGMGWSSLLSDEPKHLLARALTDVRALAFLGKDLRQACEQDPKIRIRTHAQTVGHCRGAPGRNAVPACESILTRQCRLSHTSGT